MLCEAPFLGITIDPAGNINMCCNTMDRQQFDTKITDIDDLEKFFKGKQYERLRKKMANLGMERIKNCEVCWIVNQGREAEVTNYHRRAKDIAQGGIPRLSAPNPHKSFKIEDPVELQYLEMTTSNVCNQTCVMCDSFFSTKWKKIEHNFKRTVHPTFSMSDESVDKILKVLPKLKILQIKGGEPFADKNNLKILTKLALVNPDLRVRFSTSHPKDMVDDVLHTMAKYENICKYIHLPVQSGNSDVLKRMNRGYTREKYMERIDSIKRIMPDCAISTDIITGFCGETEEEFQDTVSLVKEVNYNFSYMFFYSERPKTLAERNLKMTFH